MTLLGALRALRIKSAAMTLSTIVVVAGCCCDLDGLPTYKHIENRTDEAITIVWHRESGEQIALVEVPSGKSASVGFSEYGNSEYACDDGELVAVDGSGREVARSPTNCSPWVIGSAASPK